jgi:hypothetical protein
MNPTKITEVKAVAKKRQENFKKQGKAVKLGLCFEMVAKERGYKKLSPIVGDDGSIYFE